MKIQNLFLQAALFYAQRLHWPVFPIKPKQKEPPLIKGWETQASCDEKQIREWWSKWPNANVALLTGIDLLVLDVDFRHGGLVTFDSLEHQHGKLRDTLRQITGRQDGSFHLVYQHPPGERIAGKQRALGDGIDTRGHHNYILAHPSIHPDTGKPYFWDTAKKSILEDPVNPMDDWVIQALRAHSRNGQATHPMSDHIEKGVQHDTIRDWLCNMRETGATREMLFAAGWAADQNNCEEPDKTPERIHKMVDWVMRKVTVRPHKKWKGASEQAPSEAKPPKEAVREPSVQSYDAACEEPMPIIEAILYPGLTILAGRPKAGKSWLALQLAIAVVNQTKLAGYLEVQKQSKCLYVSLEDRRPQLKKRLRKLVLDKSYLDGLDLIYDIDPLMAGGVAQLDRSLTKNPVGVLIVDSLLAAVKQAGRKDLDIVQTDYNIITTLRELATKHGIAIVLVAHTRKMGGDFLDIIQGTSGTTAAADAVWVLQRTPEGKATLSVTGREVPQNVFGLERPADSPAWIITGEGDEIMQSDARQDIIQLLRDKCMPKRDPKTNKLKVSTGLNPSTIAKELHKNISGVNRLLADLCKQGLVMRVSYGCYNLPGENEPPEAYER